MKERDFEDILSRYPELVEERLRFKDRQVSVKGKFVDLLFADRHGHTLIVELKKGAIKRQHIAQLLDYEGHFLSPDDPTVRVMLVGNRVPPNLRKSLDHHGFEWKEITVSSLILFLKEKDDKEYLAYFPEEELETKRRPARKKSLPRQETGGRARLPSLQSARSLSELEDIIRARYPSYPTNYMDLLLLENKDKPLSAILAEFQQYAKKVDYRAFENVSYLRGHIKYREETRGWVFEYSGDQEDPVVRFVDLESDQNAETKSALTDSESKGRRIFERLINTEDWQKQETFTYHRKSQLKKVLNEFGSPIPYSFFADKGRDRNSEIYPVILACHFGKLKAEPDGIVAIKDAQEMPQGEFEEGTTESVRSKRMKPSRESFWSLLLDKTEEVCAEEGLALDLRVGSEGRFAKARTGVVGVMWAYAISRNTAWVELEIRGQYRDEVYGRLSKKRNLANQQFQSEIGERILWDKEAHDSGRDREVYRITSDSKYLFSDTGEEWNELVDDLTLRMVAFVKAFDSELQSIADAKS